jgi:hypothetical protein
MYGPMLRSRRTFRGTGAAANDALAFEKIVVDQAVAAFCCQPIPPKPVLGLCRNSGIL